MKKIIAITMPLMAIALCTNCGGNKNNHTFIFNGENCTLNNQASYAENKQTPINLTLTTSGEEYYLPDDITVLIGSKRGVNNTDYTYTVNSDKKTANLSVCISDNIAVLASAHHIYKINYEEFSRSLDFNLKHLQCVVKEDDSSDNYRLFKFGENHYVEEEQKDQQKNTDYYCKKNDNYYLYDKENESWVSTRKSNFMTISDLAYTLRVLTYRYINFFDNLIYNDTNKNYSYTNVAEYTTLEYKFEYAKLKCFTMIEDAGEGERSVIIYNFTYDDVEPVAPIPDPEI